MYYAFGHDGMLYLVFNNEDDAWEWAEANYDKWVRLVSYNGFRNSVQLASFEQGFGL